MLRSILRHLSPRTIVQAMVGGYKYYRHLELTTPDRRRFVQCGKECWIGSEVFIKGPERVVMGDSVYIGPRCWIDAKGGFFIGHYSGIGAGSTILTTDHHYAGASKIPIDHTMIVKPVCIEDYVWIGMNTVIWPGVRVGEGAIVGLGSVVTRDVEPMAIVMGNPAEVIGHRNREAFEDLKAKGSVRDICPQEDTREFWIPRFVHRKYSRELSKLGIAPETERLSEKRR